MTKPRVLVCDDDEAVRKAVRLVLERDYELVFAEDGDEGLQQYNARPADLVLLDIKMPKRDGLQVLAELTTRQPVPRILMLTAYESVELAQRATQAGAVDYVTKPFERAALLKAVERALMLPAWQRPEPGQPTTA